MNPRQRFAVFLACLCLGGNHAIAQDRSTECLPLSSVEGAKIRSILVMSSIPQEDVQHQTLPLIRAHYQGGIGGTPGLGLLGAIVAVAVVNTIAENQAEKAMARATLAFPPLLEAAKDFDFRRQFWARLDDEMGGEGRFKVLDVSTFGAERSYAEQPAVVGGERVDAVLDLRTEYALTPDLRNFVMSTQVLLQARDDNRELYRCRYDFITPPVADGEYEPAVASWAAEGAGRYRAAAVLGIQATLKMLALDLTGADAPHPSGQEVSVHDGRPIWGLGGVVRVAVASHQVHREEGVLIARDRQGVMRAVVEGNQFAPSDEVLAAARGPAPQGEGRRAGPIALDDLLGVLDDGNIPTKQAPVAPAPAPAPATRDEPRAQRAGTLEDLENLLRD